MAAIRVFLLTCRRPQLLPRALASLRAQTFTDWICELHNDAPEDQRPRQLLASTPDPRITLHQHDHNWGPVGSFNHAFAGGPEPFLTLLEDDNWWDPTFLATLHAALLARPEANVAWANLRLWQEEADGSWRDTGRTIWSAPSGAKPRLFHWPQPLQLTTALHSNGAMLCRTAASAAAQVPPSTPFAIIEPVRERLLPGGWLLLPEPLGHFALTRQTARSDNRAHWAQCQLLVAGSFLAAVPLDQSTLAAIWKNLRTQTPRSTSLIFQVALAGIHPRELLRDARLTDWLLFLAGSVRHPFTLFRALRFRQEHNVVWSLLVASAQRRMAEARAREAGKMPQLGLITKVLA
ncbi:MAG: glycosyltransferase [Opitutaceae bacterium]